MKIKSFLIMLIVLSLTIASMPLTFAATSAIDFTPYQLTVTPIAEDQTHAYGSALLTFRINNLPGDTGDNTLTWYVNVDKKIGDGPWIGVGNIPTSIFIPDNQISTGIYTYENNWIEDYAWNGTAIISYRVQVVLEDLIGDKGSQSSYSNIATLGLLASPWAIEEVQKAQGLGLIPDLLKGADLKKPITREEFCELAVLLYEEVSGKAAIPTAINPFTDTKNSQILKAYNLGITNGVTPTTFEPKKEINREQCAAMLYRDINAIRPNGDYAIAGIKDFPDQKQISPYAVEATKYMSKLDIIKGDSSGNFMPKAMTSAQTAAGFGLATREAAILMSVRTYEKLQ